MVTGVRAVGVLFHQSHGSVDPPPKGKSNGKKSINRGVVLAAQRTESLDTRQLKHPALPNCFSSKAQTPQTSSVQTSLVMCLLAQEFGLYPFEHSSIPPLSHSSTADRLGVEALRGLPTIAQGGR